MDEGFIEVEDDVRVHYRRMGNGAPTIVAAGGSLLAEDVQPLTQNHEVIFYDMRGRGRSDELSDLTRISVDNDAKDLEKVRSHFGIEALTFIGWSYLGVVASIYANRHAAQMSRFVLMCPGAPKPRTNYPEFSEIGRRIESRIDMESVKRLQKLHAEGLEQDDPEAFCREYQRVYGPRLVADPKSLGRSRIDNCGLRNEWPANQTAATGQIGKTFAGRDFCVGLEKVEAPVLVVHGREDFLPLEAARDWARSFGNARLMVLDECGHMPHLERPEIFFPAVEEFLAGEWPDGAETVESA